MKLGICSDHAGYQLKEQVKEWLAAMQIECVDYGTHSEERCDYPDYAHQLAFAVQMGTVDRGIAICGTGNGMAMTLNSTTSSVLVSLGARILLSSSERTMTLMCWLCQHVS